MCEFLLQLNNYSKKKNLAKMHKYSHQRQKSIDGLVTTKILIFIGIDSQLFLYFFAVTSSFKRYFSNIYSVAIVIDDSYGGIRFPEEE